MTKPGQSHREAAGTESPRPTSCRRTGGSALEVDGGTVDADALDADAGDAGTVDAGTVDADALDADTVDADALDADTVDADALYADALDEIVGVDEDADPAEAVAGAGLTDTPVDGVTDGSVDGGETVTADCVTRSSVVGGTPVVATTSDRLDGDEAEDAAADDADDEATHPLSAIIVTAARTPSAALPGCTEAR